MYYVVTGAAGFIGSKLVEGLNRRGITDIIAVDNLQHADKFRNLADCEIADYLDQAEFLGSLERFDGASRRCCTRARAPTPWRPTAAT